MTAFHVVIPAAGFGSRMGLATPKQYLTVAGQAVIWHTLQVFLNAPRINSVHVILSAGDTHFAELAITHEKLHVHYCGGETRAQTVQKGLQALSSVAKAHDWLLVHDAARPCLSAFLLNTLIDTLQTDAVGGLLAIPLAETLKRSNVKQLVDRTEPREGLWQAQTPQMFRYQLLLEALAYCQNNTTLAPTDESQALEALGHKPKLVAGHLSNLKITYPMDLALAALILTAPGLIEEKN